MHRFLLVALGFHLLLAAQAEPRASGNILRHDIDALVARLNDVATADRPLRKPVGGSSTLATAKALCAMGHCHRRYHTSDGPIVRPSLDALLAARRADGSFGDAELTGWVVDAFAVLDAEGLRAEIDAARRWLAQAQAPASPFENMVGAVLAEEGGGRHPAAVGAAAAQRSRELLADDSRFACDEAAHVLVQLVACQVANCRLDADAAPAFSPTQERGFAWLFAQQQGGRFAVGEPTSLALTGFGLMALQTKPAAQRTPAEVQAIRAGLRWLLAQQNEDGTWGESLQNYTTCVAVGALRTFDDPAVAPALQKAQRALLAFQNCEQNGYAPSDRDYGSIGYGGSTRGDLSNLHFALTALGQTDLPADHEAFSRAIVFLQRTQNLSASNDFVARVPDPDHQGAMLDTTPGDDGGASYYPGNSSAGFVVRPDGKASPRSYGSMTYALLKAYTLAGVPAQDARRQAALRWLEQNWRLDVNPGFAAGQGAQAPYQGLFYYYLLMAEALDTAGIDQLMTGEGDAGTPVAWRPALERKLAAQQRSDGSWINEQSTRWMEGDAMLCTCYAMLALARCR